MASHNFDSIELNSDSLKHHVKFLIIFLIISYGDSSKLKKNRENRRFTPMLSRTVLIHHHIFKNAGTSFNHALKQFFQDRYFEYDLPHSRLVTAEYLERFILEHPQAAVISSHHACLPTPQGANYQTISSILLRNPLSRIESIYQFERQQESDTQGAKQAKLLSFKDYAIWRLEKTPNMFCNYQTHYCSRIEQSKNDRRATEKDLQQAIYNLQNCAIVGLVERYTDFLKIAQQKLYRYYPKIVLENRYLNVTNRQLNRQINTEKIKNNLKLKLGEKLVGILEAGNQLDYQLYEIAQKIAERELLSVGN